LSGSISGTNVLCNGNSTGAADLSVSGGTSPYTYLWSNSATSQDLSGITAGTYNVTITDSHGCTTTASVVISQPTLLTLSAAVTSVSTSCFFTNDGIITGTASGGTGPMEYKLDFLGNPLYGYQSATSFDSLYSGDYIVTVLDAHGCTASSTVIITQPDPVSVSTSVSNYNGSGVSCVSSTDGVITASGSGGKGGVYTYSLEDDNNVTLVAFSYDSVFSNLAAGNYWVISKDSNGCDAAAYVTVTAPTPITPAGSVISDYNGKQVSCYNSSDGMIEASATDGTAPYKYKLDGPVDYGYGSLTMSPDTFSNLSPGEYTITVQDANGCTSTTTVTIDNTTVLSATTAVSSTATSCFFTNDGVITASQTGGTGSMEYKLDFLGNPLYGYQSSDTFDSLYAGDYVVTVKDANGCTATSTAIITQPDPVALTTDVVDHGGYGVTCANGTNGQITAHGSGGAGGVYTYSLEDDNNVTLVAFSYDSVFSNLAAGNYWVISKDSNGCDAAAYVTILAPDSQLTLGSIVSTDNTCFFQFDGTIDITISGGVSTYHYSSVSTNNTYSFDTVHTQHQFTDLTFDTYTVSVTDDNGCSVTSTVTISAPLALDLTSVNIIDATDSVSANGSIEVVGTGGTAPYTYSDDGITYSSLDSTFENLTYGDYYIYVKDAHNCEAVHLFSVGAPARMATASSVSQADVKVYPNPTKDILNVDLMSPENGTVFLKLVDMSGRTVKLVQSDMIEGKNYFTINMSDLSSGVYSLQVTRNGQEVKTLRVVKKD